MNEAKALWFVGGIFVGWFFTCLTVGSCIDTTRIIQLLKALKTRLKRPSQPLN